MTAEDYSAADEAVREQIRSSLQESMFVEAGAGTGKTRALVDRYASLVLDGCAVERLVAITFTEKAAAELRDRVRQELERRHAEETDLQRSLLIERALGSLDQAQISTIHAFCHALLRSFAVTAGIDPAFEVQDEVAAERRFEERWRNFLEGLATDTTTIAAFNHALDLGMTTWDLQRLAHQLWQRSELADRLLAAPLPAPVVTWPDFQALHDELAALGIDRIRQDDRLRQRLEPLAALLAELARPSSEPEADLVSRSAAFAGNINLNSYGQAQNWLLGPSIQAARAAGTHVMESLRELLRDLRGEALAAVLPLAVRFVCEDATARGREGKLLFDDLILRVRDVLHSSAEARYELRQRYQTILIDEFQDTDPLQVDIAMAFAGEPDDPQTGRLFLVGDPKQSIYRFRRADMAIYARTAAAMSRAGALSGALALNQRSQPGLLSWVNTVFEQLIGQGAQPEVQPAYSGIAPARDTELRGAAVSWLGGDLAQTAAAAIRRTEADHVAAYCRHIVTDGWEVEDRDGSVRPARLGDIAVLIPARTVLQPLERSLAAAGLPYRIEGGSLIYATQELRDLINCLTAIDDPTDEVAIVGALRSPAYACSDVEVASYKLGGGSFNYRSQSIDALGGPVAAGLLNLRRFHEERRTSRIAPLLERFISDRRLIEIGLFDAGNRDSFRRARFLIEQARALEADGQESLRAFVEWLERRAGGGILDQEGAALDDDEDAVRILTVHAAKGLEFPIVVLAGLGLAPRAPYFVYGQTADSSLAVTIGAQSRGVFGLGPTAVVMQQETQHAAAERARLLYVAATRARDHLVISLFQKAGTKDSAAQRLIEAGARDLASPPPPMELLARSEVGAFAALQIEESGLDEAAFLADRSALVDGAKLRLYTSATALGHAGVDEEAERSDDSEPWARGRGGTHLGRAVHAALQSLAWDAGDDAIETIARAQTVAEAVPAQASEAARLIRRALASDAAGRARQARRALREVPFAVRFGDVIVEGFADLVIETADGIEIVDWKTDHVPSAAVEERLRQYELQAGLYVLGLEAATGLPVTRLTYVFVSAGREASPGDPTALAEAARSRLQELAGV